MDPIQTSVRLSPTRNAQLQTPGVMKSRQGLARACYHNKQSYHNNMEDGVLEHTGLVVMLNNFNSRLISFGEVGQFLMRFPLYGINFLQA